VSLPRAEPTATAELFVTAADGTVTHLRYRDGRWTPPAEVNGLVAMGLPAPASR
jgi:hypothetical protein